MWIIYIDSANNDVCIEEVQREEEDVFKIRHSSTSRHGYLPKTITHKIFQNEEHAYNYYNKFYKSWHYNRMNVVLSHDEEELKEALKEFDKTSFNLPKLFPEDFI